MTTTSGNLTRAEAGDRARLLDVDRYRVHLDLTGERDFRSETTVTFSCREPGASTFVDLSALTVHELELNGRSLDPDEHVGATRIQLPDLAADNELRVVATCEYQHSGTGLHRAVDPVDGAVYLHTQFEPYDAHLVFACFDQPDLKARTTVSVDAPADWQVVSNMAPTTAPTAAPDTDGTDGTDRTDRTHGGDGGDGHWEFAPTPPLSTYLVAVVAGPYHRWTDEHDGVPLGVYCRESMAQHVDLDEIWTITRQGLDFFGEVFDHPYPFGKYDQLFVPEFNFGAMENPGCVTFTEGYLFRGQVTESERESRANTILHEMAHMWFGDLVTMRWWDDLWLNESFATFMATLALERATRFTHPWVTFEDEEKTWARYQDQLPTTHPISTDAGDLDAVHQNFDGITYAKGASVLRQLVAWVGEDAFLAGVRTYFQRYAYDNAELADLLAELEASSGRDDLDTWAKEWLQTAGINTIGARTASTDGVYTSVTVEQGADDGHPTLRSHRLGVGLYDLRDDEELARRTHVELDVSGAATEVGQLVGEPVADLLLPNDGDLAFCKLHLDRDSLSTAERHLRLLRDPLARSLCWGAAWEMVRDAAMPAHRYVAMVRRNVGNEPDVGVLQTILSTARTATEYHGDPAHAPELLRVLADEARTHVDEADPGSDVQLAWARHWIAVSREGGHVDAVRALLDEEVVRGLAVDTDLRWRIVKALAGIGAIDDEVIAAEHRRDPTDLGERHAAYARASRPDRDAKAAAWRRIVEEPDISHSLMKAVMGGFSRRDQAELVRPYVDPYFEHLREMFEERHLEVALAYGHRMYPTVVVDEQVVERTDRYLASDDAGPSIRRVLLEERDSILRALRTREADREVRT